MRPFGRSPRSVGGAPAQRFLQGPGLCDQRVQLCLAPFADVFSALAFFFVVFAGGMFSASDDLSMVLFLASVGGILVLCFAAPTGRQAWSRCGRLVGCVLCLVSLALAVYAAFAVSDGQVKPKSDESGDVLLAFFMLFGGYYFVALIGLGLGAGLLALGFALKESVQKILGPVPKRRRCKASDTGATPDLS